MNTVIYPVTEVPRYREQAIDWFSSKWGIPRAEYEKSFADFFAGCGPIPRWYIAVDDRGRIAGGCGLIANDFVDRTDLGPYLCALYVEKYARGEALGGQLLNYVRRDAARLGYVRLYLCTSHTDYYERYGWKFLTAATDTVDGGPTRIYDAETIK